ncbi:MAG: hypothetical protein KGK10_10030 [Rhodospirillales bacterium]|nr:hypothetical protein [Rhodospirillales bacterium]
MNETPYVPHIDLILQALRVGRDRLGSRAKIAIDARLLRKLLMTLASTLPFDETFYRANYPDLAEAHASGAIRDLRTHFVEVGFLEGRIGSRPEVDEAFYTTTYPDVAQAILRGDVPSGTEHYMRAGIAEGRVPNPAQLEAIESWFSVMRDETRI